ncbi:hypothetical protein BDQ94DRAFT_140771 [Aspergillus welwitschiae]|uniref:Uncharacterized protein n=1 Tax=Aspergillus welwitschiae TaxID=1341132 RepID=A0A3F3Q6B1_9EURO|nr:hypothetical protein BDQ94DRAFT_140771 [Aspergillus welwitschiae]RDH34708.1 hypothetical protein BDQ94DRAFT_140771 [Aspergillus welwitschiae]
MCHAVWPDSCCPTTALRCPAQLAPPYFVESFASKLSGDCRYQYAIVTCQDNIGQACMKGLQSRLFPPNLRRGRRGTQHEWVGWSIPWSMQVLSCSGLVLRFIIQC